MGNLQTILQTIKQSAIDMGWVKLIIAVVIVGLLTRVNKLLGLVGAVFLIAYLAGWII